MKAPDELAVRAAEDAYDTAWRTGDIERLVRCFTPDAVLVNPRGQVAAGLDAIRAALGGFLADEGAGTEHRSSIERVSFPAHNVAVVDGHATISTRSDAGAVVTHPFTDVLVAGELGWLIAHVRAYQYDRGPRT